MRPQLRPYQADAVAAIIKSLESQPSTLLVMATGLGKTQVGCSVAEHYLPGRILWLAHRKELVTQGAERLQLVTGEMVDIEMAELWASNRARIVSASLDSIRTRLDRWPTDHFSLIVFDEFHHAVAKSYRKVWEHFTGKKLGMTATPDRGDEKALGQLTSDVAGVWDIVDGVEGGYLCPINGRSVRVDEVDLSNIGKTAGDLAAGELDTEMAQHVEGIVAKTLELQPGRQGIWFFPGVKSAELACDRINALGEPCAFVYAETPKEERDDIMRGFKSGRYSHITNVGIATEGFDAPNADMVVIGRPTLSRALYAQMVGRGLRVLPGTVEGILEPEERRARVAASAKPHCILEGSLVLTDVGLVPIQQVTRRMKVWDGCNFVTHGGTVFRGQREVITYAGLTATLDHRVWTGSTWKAFGECAIEQVPISVTGDGWCAIREADRRFRGGDSEGEEQQCSPSDRVLRVQREVAQGTHKPSQRDSRVPSMRLSAECATVAREENQRRQGPLLQPIVLPIQGLRREGDYVWVRESIGYGYVDSGESWTSPGVPDRPHRQRPWLRTREPALVHASPEHEPHTEEQSRRTGPRFQTCTSGDSLLGRNTCSPGGKAQLSGDCRKVPPALVKTQGRVWDILDAGPLRRFTVEGLLVHNCVVIDFAGNCGRHTLITPEDLLGGDYTEEEVKKAKEKAKENPGADVIANLEAARRELKAMMAKLQSRVKATVQSFDPFALLGTDHPDPNKERFREPMTAQQKESLKKFNIKDKQMEGLSHIEAAKLIQRLGHRKRLGLCSLNQLATLRKYCDAPTNLPYRQASKAMTYLAETARWSTAPEHRAVLNKMVARQ